MTDLLLAAILVALIADAVITRRWLKETKEHMAVILALTEAIKKRRD